MNGPRLLRILAVALLLCAGIAGAAPKPDPDYERLAATLAALDADPALADLAGLERLKARQSLLRLQAARSRDRPHVVWLANRWVEAAVDAANAELLEQQATQLDRERDQIMIEASRRDAERARRDAELLRLQSLVREEEAQQLAETQSIATAQATAEVEAATAEAEQANRLAAARAREVELARKEAELAAAVAAGGDPDPPPASTGTGKSAAPPSRRIGGKTVYTLDGQAFPSGSAQLTAQAQASLRQLAAQVPKGKSLYITGHTDAQGADEANRLLSQRRADAVRRALAAAGIAPARLDAVGLGETDPVADNGSESGRAKNRRVEITVQ
jgi:outer membrane protein OmpA-like peptidoglycan-associated protein